MILLILLTLLGSHHWHHREAAHRALTPLPDLLLPAIEHAEAHAGNQEARRRCKTLVDGYYLRHADRLSRRLGKLPWIDDPYFCGDWLAQAQAAGFSSHGPEWPVYREATRRLTAARIACRLPVAAMLRDLWIAEVRWSWGQWSPCWP